MTHPIVLTMIALLAHLIDRSISAKILHIDLTLVLHYDAQTLATRSYANPEAYEGMINKLNELSPIAEGKSRVAIVANNANAQWDVLLEPTSDIAKIKESLKTPIAITGGHNAQKRDIAGGLKMAHERLVADKCENRLCLVLLISYTTVDEQYFANAKQETERSSASGALVLGVTRLLYNNLPHNKIIGGRMRDIFNDLVFRASTDNNHYAPEMSTTVPDWIKTHADIKFCAWDREGCFYRKVGDTGKTTCKMSKYASKVTADLGDCGDPPPAKGWCKKMDECRTTCDELWPLADDNVGCKPEDCGKTIETKRTGAAKYKLLENCQAVQCPKCGGKK